MSKIDFPDPRLNAYRDDLADDTLRGQVDAPRYVKGERRQVAAPVLPVRREPRFDHLAQVMVEHEMALLDDRRVG